MNLVNLVILILLVAACFLPILRSPCRGSLRYVSPEVQAFLMLLLIFGVRPLFDDRLYPFGLYGRIPTPYGLEVAQYSGLAFVMAAAVPYLRRGSSEPIRQVRKQWQARDQSQLRRLGPGQLVAISFVILGAYVMLMILFAGSGIFSTLAQGRTGLDVLAGVPVIITIMPLAGSICAALLLLNRGPGSKLTVSDRVSVTSLSILSLALVSQTGTRRFMIPAVLLPVIAYLLVRRPRVRLWHLGAGFLGVLVLATVPLVRSVGSRRSDQSLFNALVERLLFEGVGGTLRPLVASNDTEMLDYIALHASTFGYWGTGGYGRGLILDFLTFPLPSAVESRALYSDQLLVDLYGTGCASGPCPVPSVVGTAYFDFGIVGVLVGGLIFGWSIRRLSGYLEACESRGLGLQLSAVVMSSYVLVFTRTNTVIGLWWAIYTVALAAGVVLLLRVVVVRSRLDASLASRDPKRLHSRAWPRR